MLEIIQHWILCNPAFYVNRKLLALDYWCTLWDDNFFKLLSYWAANNCDCFRRERGGALSCNPVMEWDLLYTPLEICGDWQTFAIKSKYRTYLLCNPANKQTNKISSPLRLNAAREWNDPSCDRYITECITDRLNVKRLLYITMSQPCSNQQLGFYTHKRSRRLLKNTGKHSLLHKRLIISENWFLILRPGPCHLHVFTFLISELQCGQATFPFVQLTKFPAGPNTGGPRTGWRANTIKAGRHNAA